MAGLEADLKATAAVNNGIAVCLCTCVRACVRAYVRAYVYK